MVIPSFAGRREVGYSQCEWDKDHVSVLYPQISGSLINDNLWHTLPCSDELVGVYRIYGDAFFQALFTQHEDSTLEKFKEIPPAKIGHDSEWTLWQLVENDPVAGYGITSQHSITPGPFPYHKNLSAWLSRHDLDLEAYGTYVQGVAYFGDLDGDQLRDAIERLDWLELVIQDVNRLIIKQSEEFWNAIKLQSDMAAAAYEGDSEEIIPVPDTYEKRGWKKR